MELTDLPYVDMEAGEASGRSSSGLLWLQKRLDTGLLHTVHKLSQITSTNIDEFLWSPTAGVIAYSVVQFFCFLIGAFLCLQFWNAYDTSESDLADDDFGVNIANPSTRSWVLTVLWTIAAALYLACYICTVKSLVQVTKTPGLYVPYTFRKILQLFFGGFNPGSFMVSYNWNDLEQYKTQCPRTLASLLPSTWLDVNELIAGVDVTEYCAAAAQNATFRFMFLSKNYLNSRNCMTEFNTIIQHPARSFAFVYDRDRNILCHCRDGQEGQSVTLETELKNLGIPVIVLKEPYKIDAKFIFTQLLSEEVGVEKSYPIMGVLLQDRSPLVRSHWAATAAAICGDHRKGLRRYWPAKWYMGFSVLIVGIFSFLFGLVKQMSYAKQASKTCIVNKCGLANTNSLVNIQSDMTVSFVFLIIAQLLSIAGFVRMYKCVCYNPVFAELSDATLLLIVLHQLQIVPTIKVHFNFPLHRHAFGVLQEYGVIDVVHSTEQAEFSFVLTNKLEHSMRSRPGLSEGGHAKPAPRVERGDDEAAASDDLDDLEDSKQLALRNNSKQSWKILRTKAAAIAKLASATSLLKEHVLYWSTDGFQNMAPFLQQELGNVIVSDGPPSEGVATCHLLAAALRCRLKGLCIGSDSFKKLLEDPNMTDEQRTATKREMWRTILMNTPEGDDFVECELELRSEDEVQFKQGRLMARKQWTSQPSVPSLREGSLSYDRQSYKRMSSAIALNIKDVSAGIDNLLHMNQPEQIIDILMKPPKRPLDAVVLKAVDPV